MSNQTTTITRKSIDNQPETTVNIVVELVVVNDKLVPDIRSVNPGVIINKQ